MKNNLKLGVGMTLLSSLSYAVLTAIVKMQSGHVPTPVIVFIQSIVTLILIAPFMLKDGLQAARGCLNSRSIHLHFIRTLFSLGISYFLFLAVAHIPLVNGLLLANTAPLMVPFLAFFMMSQKMNHRLWLPILIGFVGIILVLHPEPSSFNPAALLALAAGFCMAMSMLLVRMASKEDSSATISFYYFLFSTLISGIIAIKYWIPISGPLLAILILEGSLFFIVQFSLATALKNSPAELVSSLYYSNIVFGAIITAFVWHVHLSWLTIVGIVLTCLGGIFCIMVQSKANRIVQAAKG